MTTVSKEIWKPVRLEFAHDNSSKIEISNWGRVRSFNRLSDGKILKPAIINGYALIRIKFYSKRADSVQKKIDGLKRKISQFNLQIKVLKEKKTPKAILTQHLTQLHKIKLDLNKLSTTDVSQRIIPYNMLIHRLVATYFCKKRSNKQTIVGHLDYNKLNNKAHNLVWMTEEQNYAHQQNSPLVKKSRKRK